MAKYLLDTNIIISLINDDYPDLNIKIQAIPASEFAVSIITHSELVYGYEKNQADRIKKKLIADLALSVFSILDYNLQCSLAYGVIKADLKRKSAYNPKNELDIQIAATAISNNLILITKNSSDFKDIPGLNFKDQP